MVTVFGLSLVADFTLSNSSCSANATVFPLAARIFFSSGSVVVGASSKCSNDSAFIVVPGRELFAVDAIVLADLDLLGEEVPLKVENSVPSCCELCDNKNRFCP